MRSLNNKTANIDLIPLKILKPKLDTKLALSTLSIFVEVGPRWSAPHVTEIYPQIV